MKSAVAEIASKQTVEFSQGFPEPSILRLLREKKSMSQEELASRAQISRREVQGIEKKMLEELRMRDIRLFAAGLGCAPSDLMKLIDAGEENDFGILRCSLDQPVLTTRFEEGSELLSFVGNGTEDFIGLLHLEVKKSISWDSLFMRELLFGMVLKGTLLLDSMGMERILKERTCFCIRSRIPFTMHNNDAIHPASILLFSTGLTRS